MSHNDGPSVGPIAESTVLETCGERDLPTLGVVEQCWETDPIPPRAEIGRASCRERV